MTRYGRIDYSKNPSQEVGWDERRACADMPTWYWFALPLRREAESEDDIPYVGGDGYAERKAGHERALITCAHCPLVVRCLQSSWHTEEYGTYGAVTEVERFLLGGRGRSSSNARTYSRYLKALARVTKRFGSEKHPAVQWIIAQGLPHGISADEPAEDEGAA